jgi:hypothetical protein
MDGLSAANSREACGPIFTGGRSRLFNGICPGVLSLVGLVTVPPCSGVHWLGKGGEGMFDFKMRSEP